MNYVTTNIRISEEDYLRLKEEAAKKRKSLSAVIREKIEKKKKNKKDEFRENLLKLAGAWKGTELESDNLWKEALRKKSRKTNISL